MGVSRAILVAVCLASSGGLGGCGHAAGASASADTHPVLEEREALIRNHAEALERGDEAGARASAALYVRDFGLDSLPGCMVETVGDAAWYAGDNASARVEYERLRRVATVAPEVKAEATYRLGWIDVDEGHPERALPLFIEAHERAVAVGPSMARLARMSANAVVPNLAAMHRDALSVDEARAVFRSLRVSEADVRALMVLEAATLEERAYCHAAHAFRAELGEPVEGTCAVSSRM